MQVFDLVIFFTALLSAGGHWPRKGVWGCAALKTPFSRLSCSSQGFHFKQKSQFTRPPFWENLEILTSTANFHPNFSSQAPKFGNFQLTSPQIWKFSVHKPPFQRQTSVRKPHTSEIRAAHPYLKKSWVPPPPGLSDDTVHSDQADNADTCLSCIIGVKLVCTNYEVAVLGTKKKRRFPVFLLWIGCSHHALAENRHCITLHHWICEMGRFI